MKKQAVATTSTTTSSTAATLTPGPGRPRSRHNVPTPIRALERGLSVLEQLAHQAHLEQGLPLSVLSRHIKLPVSTTYRILETLRSCRFVQYDPSTRVYRLGIKAFEVGLAYLTGQCLEEVARPAMKQLVDQINENINLAVRDEHEVVYIVQLECQQTVRMFTRVGARSPLHCTGVGKILLAWLPYEQIREILGNGPFERYTPATICDCDAYMNELERVRRQGYALDNEERQAAVRCIAAPVRNQHGQVIAAVSTSAPIDRMPLKIVRQTRAKQIMAVGKNISTQLGLIEKTR